MMYSIKDDSKNYDEAKKWLYEHEEICHELLNIYSEAIIQHLIGQANAGAQILEIFESNSGIITPKLFRKYVLPYLNKIYIDVRKQIRKDIPITIFAREANFIIEDLIQIGFEIISLGWGMDPKHAINIVGNRVSLQGNLDPWALFGTNEEIETNVFDMLDAFEVKKYEKKRLIVNLGHGMMPSMEPRCVQALIDSVRKYEQTF